MLYLYLLKVDHDTSFSTTWNIPNLNFQPKNNSTIMMVNNILLLEIGNCNLPDLSEVSLEWAQTELSRASLDGNLKLPNKYEQVEYKPWALQIIECK